jgi:hypothetical protein
MVSSNLNSLDFYADLSLVVDPCPHYEELRQYPVQRDPHHGVVMVSGHGEVTIRPSGALIATWASERPLSDHATAPFVEM